MGLINLTLPSDGETIDAADVNTPFGTIATAINGNLDNANIKSGAAIDGTKIASATLTATQMADSVSPVKRWDEGLYDFVASGGVWTGDAYGSTLAGSMTAGVVYINGKRVSVSAVTAYAFTASRDTYVDVDENGTLSYNPVTNNAASPALAANSIRIAIIVSGGSSIANVAAINQGQRDKILPIASSVPYAVTDSLGNLICNRSPRPVVIGYRQIIANFTTSSGSDTQVTGVSVPVIIPGSRNIKLTAHCGEAYNTGANGGTGMSIWDGTVGSGTQIHASRSYESSRPANSLYPLTIVGMTAAASGSKTYNLGAKEIGSTGTATFVGSSTQPILLMVELV